MNMAFGRVASAGGGGNGQGGGFYVTSGGAVTLKKTSFALKFASTSNQDIYGTVIDL